jgi:lambda family phage portal protein
VHANSSFGNGETYRSQSVTHQDMAVWQPGLRSADSAWAPGRDLAKARADDLIRNDGAAASGVEKSSDLLVGNQWTLSAKPDGDALGLNPEQAHALGRQMERQFNRWGSNLWCDKRRRCTFPMLLTLAARETHGAAGESFGVLGWRERALDHQRAFYATCLDIVDADRVRNPMGGVDNEFLRSGIEIDSDGAPIAAHFRGGHPGDTGFYTNAFQTTRVPWETETGRPIIVHWAEPFRAGQTRGVSRFAAILAPFKQLSRLADAEIGSAVINAMFSAFIKSGFDPAAVAESLGGSGSAGDQGQGWQDMRMGIYENAPVLLNGNKIPILAPGDEVEVQNQSRDTAEFVGFRSSFLQTIAAALGISYEQLQADFTKTTYSSARAALNEVWRWVKARRAGLIAQFVQPIYYAVMEEAFDRGYITPPPGAPDFYEAWDLYLKATWIGPARGYIDPVKERQAAQIGMEIGVTTGEMEAAEQGGDYEDNLNQRAVEERMRRDLRLPPVASAIYMGGAPSPPPEEARATS